MSTPERTPKPSEPRPLATSNTKSTRVLACVLCQQRKIRCDRNFPCSNCIKSNAQCVPAGSLAPRPRRRRFPERELLERLQQYENLLRQNEIAFEPLHHYSSATASSSRSVEAFQPGHQPSAPGMERSVSPSARIKIETTHQPKDFWNALNGMSLNSDDDGSNTSHEDVPEVAIKNAWGSLHPNRDHALFGSRDTTVNVSTLHPEQVHIFKLWQVYLDNVSPLLKVTHTPTLQTSIINAASNVSTTELTLTALMFGIYCVAVMSLDEDECFAMFGSPKDQLLTKYRFGCNQALIDCGYLRSTNRDCLTALYLYMVSVGHATDPQSLSSMLGVAIRIAQRMGLHTEATYARLPALEAELRRRLWWSLILFDARVCELADYKTTFLTPTWDCKIPQNLNDFDLQPGIKVAPVAQKLSSEAIFAVVRSKIGNFIRFNHAHLDFTNPALKVLSKSAKGAEGDLLALEKMIEEEHLKFCNEENPLHFMTIWMARGFIARNYLLEHFATFLNSATRPTDAQRDAAITYAWRTLECDIKLTSSPLTKGYAWFINTYFPFPGCVHIAQDLRTRPSSDLAERSWELLSKHYDARFTFLKRGEHPIFKIYARLILQAWQPRERAMKTSGEPVIVPLIVTRIRGELAQIAQDAQNAHMFQPFEIRCMDVDFSPGMPLGTGLDVVLSSTGEQNLWGSDFGSLQDFFEQDASTVDPLAYDSNRPALSQWTSLYQPGLW